MAYTCDNYRSESLSKYQKRHWIKKCPKAARSTSFGIEKQKGGAVAIGMAALFVAPPHPLIKSRDVCGSAEPALVLYALSTENLPRCSHTDAIYDICYYGYQTASGSAARQEGSWLGFNDRSITGMRESKTKGQLL